jgi:hypothetical protein
MSERRFGRFSFTDERDKNFQCKPVINETIRSKMWFTPYAVDQGATEECVCFAGITLLQSAPIENKTPLDHNLLYQDCRKIDGIDPKNQGTTIRALFQVLKNKNLISEYNWAFDVNTMAAWVLSHGPMIVGTNWYSNMMNLLRGFAMPGGDLMGGHSYVIKGIDLDLQSPDGSKGAFRILNSKGREWGENGCAFISFEAMTRLLSEGGEAGTVVYSSNAPT